MLRIEKLYTIPETIEPIEFNEGLNLILGEKDISSDKTNGVGKSLSIEFINFALLKKKSDSRVAAIPKDIFPNDTLVCIDFKLGDSSFTIQRSPKDSDEPTIIENGVTTKFTKLDDAIKVLTEKMFAGSTKQYPSFRIMLGPLIRDERSEFKSLINCYDTKQRIPENYAPHLFLLGINIELYETIKLYLNEIDQITSDIARIKENVLLIRQKDLDDARSDLNELDNEVHSIEGSIEKLENITGYEIVKEELISVEDQIETLRRKKSLLKQQISKLKTISQKIDITTQEVSEFYEQMKAGLGNLISKSLEEVILFKSRIDEFQNRLINERKATLNHEVDDLNKQIAALDKKYTQNLAVLNQKGELKNLKQTYAAYKEKYDQLSQLRSFVDRYDQLELDKQKSKSDKETNLLKLQSEIQTQKKELEDFEKTILEIHEYIQGNRLASFQLKNSTKKQIVEIVMRIDSDGSHSVEREKVFIYDIALLLNKFTKKRHPGFLIHDNIFDVDQDTLVKSIKFLEDKASFGSSQYILTLNSDRLEINNDNFSLDKLEPFVKARFTKQNRFLKKKYQENYKGDSQK